MVASPMSSSLKRRRGHGRSRVSVSTRCIRKAIFVFMIAVYLAFSWKFFQGSHHQDIPEPTTQQEQERTPQIPHRGIGVVRRFDSPANDWKTLHNPRYQNTCLDFDNSILRPKHGCQVNKDTKIVFCNFENLRIDASKISMVARGGEELSEVMGRPEKDEFPTYQKGAFSTPTKPNFDVPTDYRSGQHYLENVLNALKYPTKKNMGKLDLSCQKTFPGTTLFITRYEYVNLYHTLTDWWNAFMVLPRKPKTKSSIRGFFGFTDGSLPKNSNEIGNSKKTGVEDTVFQKPDRVVFLDGHAKGLLDSTWQTLFGEYHFIQHIAETFGGGGICFERAIFVPTGYKSPVLKDYQREACVDKEMTKAFSNFVLNGHGLLSSQVVKGNVVVIDRQPFVSHPRSNPNNAARRFHNSQIEELQKQLGGIQGVSVHLVRLETLSFREQLELIRKTHVLIGIHGAGLSHLAFMDETQSHSIEFASNALEHFVYLSEWKGMDHNIIELSNNGIEEAVRLVEQFMNA